MTACEFHTPKTFVRRLVLEHVRERLSLRLQPRVHCGIREALGGQPVYEPLGALALGLVEVRHGEARDVTWANLSSWKLTPPQAFALASANVTRARGCRLEELRPGLFSAHGQNGAALLSPPPARTRGEAVMMVPGADALMLCGDRDVEGLNAMLDHVERELDAGRLAAPAFFQWTGRHWLPFVPADSAVRARWLASRQRWTSCEYVTQLLELRAAGWPRSGAIAAQDVVRCEGHLRTAVVASLTTPLLPKSEVVLFPDGRATSWALFADVMCDALEPRGMYPELYELRAEPTPGQCAAMELRKLG